MKRTIEDDLHIGICNYIKMQYSDVIFTSESSGEYLGKGKLGQFRGWILRQKRSRGKLADIIILQPNKRWHGLILEVKANTPMLKDGTVSKGKHIQKQHETMQKLLEKGYYTAFVWCFDAAKILIDNYLKDKEPKQN